MDESTGALDSALRTVSALRSVISAQGRFVCDVPGRLQAALMETCPDQSGKIDLLLRAHEARIPADLIWSQAAPRADLGNRLVARLQSKCSLSETDARWAVVAWMDALDAKTPRPKAKPAHQAVPATGLAAAESAPPDPKDAASQPTSAPSKPAANQAAPVQRSASKKPSGSPGTLPGWVVGVVALVVVAGLGVFLYVATSTPPKDTPPPGVITKFPPNYKPPMRMVHGHPVPLRQPKSAS